MQQRMPHFSIVPSSTENSTRSSTRKDVKHSASWSWNPTAMCRPGQLTSATLTAENLNWYFAATRTMSALTKPGGGGLRCHQLGFVNFIAMVMTCRMLSRARYCGLLKEMTYGDLMDDLSETWRKVDAPDPPRTDDGRWVHTLKKHLKSLKALACHSPYRNLRRSAVDQGRIQKWLISPNDRVDALGKISCRQGNYSPADWGSFN